MEVAGEGMGVRGLGLVVGGEWKGLVLRYRLLIIL